MATRTITCRAHGGTFTIEARRGRPPVSCTDDNRCATTSAGKSARQPPVGRAVKRAYDDEAATQRKEKAQRDAEAIASAKRKATENATKAVKQVSAALDKALAAKARLEPLGWKTTGTKLGTDVVLTGVRGEERIIIRWNSSGEMVGQQYDWWEINTPKRNAKPASKLPFDPDEVSDRELIRMLSGTKVTWWNALGGSEETAVVNPEKVKIEHAYDGHGDETPGDRILTFVDASGGGFRSFRLAALLKVG